MNPSIAKLRINAIIDSLRFMPAGDLIRLINAANYELAQLIDENIDEQDYLDMLAEQGA